MLQVPLYGEGRLPVVLIVDDNPAIRDMVSWALELDGYEPVEVAEGQEALNWIDNAAHEGRYPAVILLNLAVVNMDGLTFLRQLQAYLSTSPCAYRQPAIIVITSDVVGKDVERLGVERVIVKPFHVRDLLDIVHQLIY